MGRAERLEFCEVHWDAIYPKIKIILNPMRKEMPALHEDQINLYSVVIVDDYVVPCYQEWNGTIPIQQAVDMFKEMCQNVKNNYKVSEIDIRHKELFK